MITHYYLYLSTGIVAITNTNDANKCFHLTAEQSRLNANNYVYYAASKSSSTEGYGSKDRHVEKRTHVFPLGIYGNCNDFPTPPASGHELLEIDIEDPSDNGPDVASPVTVTFIATDLEIGVEDTTRTP